MLVVAVSGSVGVTGAEVFIWGFVAPSSSLFAKAWVGRRRPDQLEAGSLIIVAFLSGIVIAAVVGGALVDAIGVVSVNAVGAVHLLLGVVQFGISEMRSAASGRRSLALRLWGRRPATPPTSGPRRCATRRGGPDASAARAAESHVGSVTDCA